MDYIYGFFMAWGMFLSIPCPFHVYKENARGNMLVMFPVIGACVGGIWYLLYRYSGFLPFYPRTVLIAVTPWLLTGFIHLDGFMDVCDAVLSRRDMEARKKILKDPGCGAFAVICVVILALFEVAAIASVLEYQTAGTGMEIIAVPITSRVCAAFAVINMKPIDTSQYSGLKKKKEYNLLLFLMMAALLSVWFYSPKAGLVVTLTAAAYWGSAWYGMKMLSGMSGDISGYALSIAEVAGLYGLLIL